MNFSPNDLQNISFKKSVMGYNEDQVNDVLDKIIEDYSMYIRENIEYKDKVVVLNEGVQHYKNIEETLQNTLLVAQKTGEDIKKNAGEKAENIIKEAELKAQELIKDANQEVIKIRFEYEELKKQFKIYKAKMQALMNSQFEIIKEIDIE